MRPTIPILFLFFTLWASAQSVHISVTPAYTQAQILPEYPGGTRAMNEYMESTDYPDIAILEKKQGTVVLSFTITETGEVAAIRILQSSGYRPLDITAAHEVNDMPDWTPGFKYGCAVPVLMTISVKYTLPERHRR